MQNLDQDLAAFWSEEKQKPLKSFLNDEPEDAIPNYKPRKDDIIIEMVDLSDDEAAGRKRGRRVMTSEGVRILDEEESEGDTCEESLVEGNNMRDVLATLEKKTMPLKEDFSLEDLLREIKKGEPVDELIERAWVEYVQPEVDALRETIYQADEQKYQRIVFFLLVMAFQQRYGTGEVEFVQDGLEDISTMHHWVFEAEISAVKKAVVDVVDKWEEETSELVGETKNHARHLPGFWDWMKPFYKGNFKVVKFSIVDVLKTDNAKVKCAITDRNKSKNAMAMRCVCRAEKGKNMVNSQFLPKPLGRLCYLTVFFLGFFGCGPNYLWGKMHDFFETEAVPAGRYSHKTWYGKCAIFLLEDRPDVFEYICRFPFEYRKAMDDHFGISHDDDYHNFVFSPNKKSDNPVEYKVKPK